MNDIVAFERMGMKMWDDYDIATLSKLKPTKDNYLNQSI